MALLLLWWYAKYPLHLVVICAHFIAVLLINLSFQHCCSHCYIEVILNVLIQLMSFKANGNQSSTPADDDKSNTVTTFLSSSLGNKTVAGSNRSCISSACFGIQII
jgi:hypothetical protein